ncbi:MAG: hypothetical protein J2P57_13035 [Acidimicrobiaceae bacterium]|nr:hypothetical protein [Acidimicrobiaceae bacterium]
MGSQLTLHVPIATPGGRPVLEVPISAPLTPLPAHALPLPPVITGGAEDVTYEVLELRHSHTYLEVHTRLMGQLQRVIAHYSPKGGGQWPGVFVVTQSHGHLIPVARRRGLGRPNFRLQEEARVFAVSQPGDYRIVIEKGDERDHNAQPGSPGRQILATWPITIA